MPGDQARWLTASAAVGSKASKHHRATQPSGRQTTGPKRRATGGGSRACGVFESARQKALFAGAMQRQEIRESLASTVIPERLIVEPRQRASSLPRRLVSAFAIHQQIHLASEPRERCHHRASAAILDDELRDEERIGEVRERVSETLRGMHSAQGVEIGFCVFARMSTEGCFSM